MLTNYQKFENEAPDFQNEEQKAKQAFLSLILGKLNDHHIEYAVVHPGNSRLPDVNSDVDLVFGEDPRKLMDHSIEEICKHHKDSRLVQRLFYDVFCGYYYILAIPTASGFTFLHLDCLYDPFGINRYHLPTPYLLENRLQTTYGYRCSLARETEYLFLKRIIKNSWTHSSLQEVRRILLTDREANKTIAKKWLGAKNAALVDTFLRTEQHSSIDQHLGDELKWLLESSFSKKHFFKWVARRAMTLLRNMTRVLRPTGYFVAIVGPDGAGKSTINQSVQHALKRGFRHLWHFHWRPKLLPKLSRTSSAGPQQSVEAPPERSQYRGLISFVRFVYYWVDFVLGYWLIIYPRRVRSTLIIGERYFPDVLVHPERYGFDIPNWLMRLAALTVPAADMTILLKDSPEAIFKRKPELSVKKIQDQIIRYEEEILHWRSPSVIQTENGVNDTSKSVVSLIVNNCHRRLFPHA